MPYLRIEYSSNINHEIRLDDFLDKLHAAIVHSGVFPLGGIRIRAYACETYRVGDCDPENAFVHASLELGHGRSIEVRKTAGELIFKAMTDHLKPVFDRRPMGISFQMHELHPELNFKLNNMHSNARVDNPSGRVP